MRESVANEVEFCTQKCGLTTRRQTAPSPLPFRMSTTEQKPRSLTPEEFPFTAPQMMSRYVTDTGKILPRKYTHLSAKQQRTITRTLKTARNLLLAP
jgi:small subunit ribosomal protein S18